MSITVKNAKARGSLQNKPTDNYWQHLDFEDFDIRQRANALKVLQGIIRDRMIHTFFHAWRNDVNDVNGVYDSEWIDAMMSDSCQEEWNDGLPPEYPDFMVPDDHYPPRWKTYY